MHVVGHQAVGPDLDRALRALLGEQVAIERVVGRLEEYRLAAVAALGHVVGKARATMRPIRAMGASSAVSGKSVQWVRCHRHSHLKMPPNDTAYGLSDHL